MTTCFKRSNIETEYSNSKWREKNGEKISNKNDINNKNINKSEWKKLKRR